MAYGLPASFPPEMMRFLEEKYRQSNVQTNANAVQSMAAANLANQQATQVAPLAQAKIGVDNATAGLDRTREKWWGGLSQAEMDQRRASANLATQQALQVAPMAAANIRSIDAETAYRELQKKYLPASTSIDNLYKLSGVRMNDANTRNIDVSTLNQGQVIKPEPPPQMSPLRYMSQILPGFQQGTARVPGVGSGDNVPAMLEPGEAILNKHAAGMIGRDKIAAANKRGNDMRRKEMQGKVAEMIKMMGMA